MRQKSSERLISVATRLPLPNHRVIAVCKGFRCLGYRDDQGIWRDDLRNRELKEVIGWAEFLNAFQQTDR